MFDHRREQERKLFALADGYFIFTVGQTSVSGSAVFLFRVVSAGSYTTMTATATATTTATTTSHGVKIIELRHINSASFYRLELVSVHPLLYESRVFLAVFWDGVARRLSFYRWSLEEMVSGTHAFSHPSSLIGRSCAIRDSLSVPSSGRPRGRFGMDPNLLRRPVFGSWDSLRNQWWGMEARCSNELYGADFNWQCRWITVRLASSWITGTSSSSSGGSKNANNGKDEATSSCSGRSVSALELPTSRKDDLAAANADLPLSFAPTLSDVMYVEGRLPMAVVSKSKVLLFRLKK